MNILSIDTDPRLAMGPNKVMGDSQEEALFWGRHLSHLSIITLSSKQNHSRFKKLSDNIDVYPTASSSIFNMLFDAWSIGRKICKNTPIDLITTKDPFLTGLCGLWLKNEFHIPLNIRLHNNCLNNGLWLQERWLNNSFNALGNFVLQRADTILAVHPSIAKNIHEALISRLFCLHSDVGINVDNFMDSRNGTLRGSILPNGKQTLILFGGRLEPEKNLKNLLLAMKDLVIKNPTAMLVILGEGSIQEHLKKLSDNAGLQAHVRFQGPVPHQQMPDFIKACDVVVLPSNHEGGGRIIIEALLMKRPVVATDVGFARDIIRDGKNGYIIPSGSPEDITRGLLKALDSSSTKHFDENYIRDLRKKFDRKNIFPEMLNVWERTKEQKARP